ncbi:MAG: chemotaxis protein CheW [bacterium]
MAQKNKKQIVLFKIDRESWGLEILNIQEIIRIVEISSVPDAPSFVEGVINARGKVVPIINLRRMMKFPIDELAIDAKIIIVKVENFVVGFIVDVVEDILAVEENKIELVQPGFYAKDFVREIVKLEDKLVFLLNVNKVLELEKKSLSEISEKKDCLLGKKAKKMCPENSEKRKVLRQRALDLAKISIKEDEGKKNSIIVFLLNNEWYGIEELRTKEILNMQKIFFVPQAPDYMEGIINERGTIVPIVNLSKFLGMEKSSILPSSKILVIDKYHIAIGLLVDAIDEVVHLDWDVLQHAFTDFPQEWKKTRFVKGEFQWREKVIAILDAENIINFRGSQENEYR